MSAFLELLSPGIVQALGWTLVHFLWQGAVIAVLLYAAAGAFRSAAARYNIALAALLLMLLAPLATFLSLRHDPASAGPLNAALHAAPLVAVSPMEVLSHSASPLPRTVDWLSVMVWFWLAGVSILSARSIGGWLLLQRFHREKANEVPAAIAALCAGLQRQLGLSRPVRFCQSCLVEVPAVVGWFRPLVLLPASALSGLSPQQVEAVVAHELAHIRRLDALVNLFQIAVETVLFYHPAVWYVSRQIRAEREHCCDDVAVELSGNALDYARALTLMETRRSTPAMAIAVTGGRLKQRISRILGMRTVSGGLPVSGLAILGLLSLAGSLIAGTLFGGEALNRKAAVFSLTAQEQTSYRHEISPSTPKTPDLPAPQKTLIARQQKPAGTPARAEARANARSSDAGEQPSTDGKESYISGLAAAGLKNLSVDEIIALKIQGVTPAYIRDIHAAGLNPSIGQLIAMRVQGVTPEYIRDVRDGGWNKVTVNDLIALRVQGVKPSDAAKFQKLGIKDLTPGRMIALKAMGVTPAYIQALQAAGYRSADAGEYIAAKAQGVTPEFIDKARQHGFSNLSLDKLMALKRADVF